MTEISAISFSMDKSQQSHNNLTLPKLIIKDITVLVIRILIYRFLINNFNCPGEMDMNLRVKGMRMIKDIIFNLALHLYIFG